MTCKALFFQVHVLVQSYTPLPFLLLLQSNTWKTVYGTGLFLELRIKIVLFAFLQMDKISEWTQCILYNSELNGFSL